MSNKRNILDVENIVLAALRGQTLKQANIKETEEAQKLWRITVASAQKMYKSGIDVEIPF